MFQGLHSFFGQHQFVHCHTPVLTSNDCEGGGEAFRVVAPSDGDAAAAPDAEKFFHRSVYTTVSSQLHLEFLACSLARVYTIGPCFRAEPSDSTRHLAEFWMLEAEMAFVGDLDVLLDFIEAQIQACIAHVLQHSRADLEFFEQHMEKGLVAKLEQIASEPFGRVTYSDAVALLLELDKPWTYPVRHGLPLQSEHERYLAEAVFKKPVFVTEYPQGIKPFYMKARNGYALCTDLLFPKWGEVVGGSLREDCPQLLDSNIRAAGLDPKEFDWYMDLRRFGTVPHGGYGLGFERLLGVVTGMSNIRDLIPAPRYLGSCRY
ncbi:hypothetical protein HDU91_001871 [Kappamyces sp. JEL0680]|nr:hypothetical protein HDU91_001871 [Kappamyces sp. JEL0680]